MYKSTRHACSYVPIAREGCPVAIHQVDHVPVIELSIDCFIVGEDASDIYCAVPYCGRAKIRFAAVETILQTVAPPSASLMQDPLISSASAALSDVVARRRAVEAHGTLMWDGRILLC